MQLLSIYKPQEDAILRSISRPVSSEHRESGEVQRIIDEMAAYSDTYPMSVWFSAIQFGHPLQIFLINCRPTPNFPTIQNIFQSIVINPVIKHLGEEMFAWYEWCMSIIDADGIPTHRWRVKRSTSVVFDYTDKDGLFHADMKLEWFTAVIFQHEYDHLQGKLIDEVGYDKIDNATYLERKNSGEEGLYLNW